MAPQYPQEIDPAKELFWHNMMEALKKTTKTKILQELKADIEIIKQKSTLIESITHTIASVFKVGADGAEKAYPSKRK